jgi:hypothetical protein
MLYRRHMHFLRRNPTPFQAAQCSLKHWAGALIMLQLSSASGLPGEGLGSLFRCAETTIRVTPKLVERLLGQAQ